MDPETSHPPRSWIVDLDGVMWRGDRAIRGSVEAVTRLLDGGFDVVFCTNNSAASAAKRSAELQSRGVPQGFGVVTSADAVATLIEPGWRVMSVGGPGLAEALGAAVATSPLSPATPIADNPDTPDGEVVDVGGPGGAGVGVAALATEPHFDAVVVGLTRHFNYQVLDVASAAVRGGASLLASNGDTTFPGADGLPGSAGLHPGGGSLVAAVEAASGVPAAVAGKPHEPMAEAIRRRCGEPGLVVGDRGDTDGLLAQRLGWPFALVLSGVTTGSDLPLEVPVAIVCDDFAQVVDRFGV